MSKKTFINKGGFESLLDNPLSKSKPQILQNEKNDEYLKKITIRIKSTTANTIKDIAYWNRISVTKFIETALETAIEEHNKKNKPQ